MAHVLDHSDVVKAEADQLSFPPSPFWCVFSHLSIALSLLFPLWLTDDQLHYSFSPLHRPVRTVAVSTHADRPEDGPWFFSPGEGLFVWALRPVRAKDYPDQSDTSTVRSLAHFPPVDDPFFETGELSRSLQSAGGCEGFWFLSSLFTVQF